MVFVNNRNFDQFFIQSLPRSDAFYKSSFYVHYSTLSGVFKGRRARRLLRAPFLGHPSRCFTGSKFISFFVKTLLSRVQYTPKQIISEADHNSAFKGAPQQQLQWASTLLSKGQPTATLMRKYSFLLLKGPVMPWSQERILGRPHKPSTLLDLMKRSYHGWLSMMTSSEGPVVSLDLGPSNQSPPLLTLILSLLRSGPCGSEQPIHRERPVATQHPLRNCVDHLAAPSHIYAPPRVETGQ